jgi:acid stress-induced BolA-like protein IbaG/YrbA
MESRVKSILETAFQGIKVLTEELPDGRISGSLIWAGFDGFDEVDRQTMVRNELRDKLGTDARQVGVLLTYTPDELEAMNAA